NLSRDISQVTETAQTRRDSFGHDSVDRNSNKTNAHDEPDKPGVTTDPELEDISVPHRAEHKPSSSVVSEEIKSIVPEENNLEKNDMPQTKPTVEPVLSEIPQTTEDTDDSQYRFPPTDPIIEDITAIESTEKPEQEPEQEIEQEPEPNISMTVNVPEDEPEAKHIQSEFYDPTAELSSFRSPSIDLLEDREVRTDHVDLAEQEENKQRLTETLSTYGVKISHIEATVGPTITRYEVIPAQGERIRSIKSLGDDLALSLAALGIRIIAPIPGKGTIGIEVPNKDPQIVGMKSIFASEKFQNTEYELPIAMGRTITNEIYIADLAKLPHLLVAGATGMGKSVGLNAIIASLLFKKHPAELKFVLIDPKRVELSLYRKLERHYLAALPGEDAIITDTSKVVAVLNSLCIEMGNRLSLLEDAGVRNIKEYNAKFIARRLNPNKHKFMPYIVLIIDEFADIILTAGKEVENPVSRLAAVARAAGIHLILATQRPAVNVITGGIKTNIPGRIAFRTIQSVDSRTILDRTGAEQLVGKGDMIFSKDGVLERVQCAFIDTDEVKAICDSIGDQIGYDGPYDLPEFIPAGEAGASKGGPLTDRDPLFEESGRLVIDSSMGSASNLQRKFNIGYPRAGKIMDQLEIAGVVGPPQGGKPRQVLMDMMAFEEYLRNSGSNK
ncbi:MAG: DNA translocase FtsK, partial [Paramuribaculum sp.]|nr:DNA translocase FtsK [Paramuribaculum sp.]